MSANPQVIVIAGPNGAGKTTLAPFLLRDMLDLEHYVNADPIASGLSSFTIEVLEENGWKRFSELIHERTDQTNFDE